MRNNISPISTVLGDLFNRNISEVVGTDCSQNNPAVNIIEHDDSFSLELAAPGLKKSDFNIELDKEHLKISASQNEDDSNGTGDFTRKEYNYSTFSRKFIVPNSLDRETVSATYENGVLQVSIAKKEEAKEKGIKSVKVS